MAQESDPPGTQEEHADTVEPRRQQLINAIEKGAPVILGERLPEWTPEDGEPPPANLVVFADTLRQVLLNRELTTRADPRGLAIRGAIIDGDLDLADSTVGYPLRLTDCLFTASLTVESATLHSLDLAGSHLAGAVRLLGAHISGQLFLRGCSIGADCDGNSVNADLVRVDGNAFLDEGFAAAGAIRLLGAHITGILLLRRASIGTDRCGKSVNADRVRVDGAAFLDDGFTAAGAVRLIGSDLGDLLVGDTEQSLPTLGDVTGWRIRDVKGVVRTNRRVAADWLDTQPAAQPWQELAAVYERNGQPADARWMRYRSAVHSTRSTRWRPSWLGRQAYRWTTGHGYYPLRALVWLVVIFGLAWSLSATNADVFTTTSTPAISADLDDRAEAAPDGRSAAEGPPIPEPPPGRVLAAWCSDAWNVTCLDSAVYALTTAFPAAATAQPWAPPDGPLTVVFYVLRLAAWVFTALLLAGVTGLLRRQT